jgi:hypothetical protein
VILVTKGRNNETEGNVRYVELSRKARRKMIKTEYRPELETVLVTAKGKTLDWAWFTDAAEAIAYKRGVRRWARERGLAVQVISQVGMISRTPSRQEPVFGLAN